MPTHVVINNEPDKKDKKTLDFLKAEIITIKMIGHSVSLVKKKQNFTRHVLYVRPVLMAYLEPSIKVVDYPETSFPWYATYLVSDGFFEFCKCLWIVLVHMVGLNVVNPVTLLERSRK